MPPNDPRLLKLTEEELAVEVELLHVLRGYEDTQPEAVLRTCDQCDGETYRHYCPYCPDAAPLTLLERLVAKEERGEHVDWTEEYDKVIWSQVDSKRNGA